MIEKEKLVTISSELKNLNFVIDKFLSLKDTNPVLAKDLVNKVSGLSEVKQMTAASLSEKMAKIKLIDENYVHLDNDINETIDINSVDLDELLKKLIYYKTLITKCETEIKDELDTYEKLSSINKLDINVDYIFSSRFLSIRIGKMPLNSVKSLIYYTQRPFMFEPLQVDDDIMYCIYFTTPEYKSEVDNIFSLLRFQRIYIPAYVHGNPKTALEVLHEQTSIKEANLKNILSEQEEFLKEYKDILSRMKYTLNKEYVYYDALKYVVGMGERFSINFFIASNRKFELMSLFEDNHEIELEIKPATSDPRIQTPTKLKSNWFTSPFQTFVKMYGVPKYGTLDPTLIFSITYCLFFGIMFGDLGQGLVMIVLGLLMTKITKKFKSFGALIVRLGIFSSVFGFIYGSVFGFENWLDWFYIGILHLKSKPIEVFNPSTTMMLLIATIGLGIFMILFSIGINIFLNFKKKNYAKALFSHNGITGFIFYAFLVSAIALQMLLGIKLFTPLTIILLIVIPVLLIFLQTPLERVFKKEKFFEGGIGAFVIDGFFELFEIMLSYLTSTVSFVRIGGFIVSHAGMMLVVHTLMSMTSGAGSVAVAVIGNIFVMGLEGLVAGIQGLRLEYYELFSRFYEADGLEYKAIK